MKGQFNSLAQMAAEAENSAAETFNLTRRPRYSIICPVKSPILSDNCDNGRLRMAPAPGQNTRSGLRASPGNNKENSVKLSDIARLAGVSVTTASYVINGKAEQQRISNATVERASHPTRRPPACAADTPAPWASFSRIWRTPATPASPSSWSKAPAPVATSC